MDVKTELSKAAIALLRRRLETQDNRVDDSNREAYRELVRAGIMFAVSGFVSGPEASFRFTDLGWGAGQNSSATIPIPDSLCQLHRLLGNRQVCIRCALNCFVVREAIPFFKLMGNAGIGSRFH